MSDNDYSQDLNGDTVNGAAKSGRRTTRSMRKTNKEDLQVLED